MFIKKINYICCPNGFGHFKRFTSLNNYFEKNNIGVYLYTNKLLWEKYSDYYSLNYNNIIVKDNNYPTYKIPKDHSLEFFKNLSKKINGNLIISDNYEEICFFKKNVILLSNFFWNLSDEDTHYLSALDKTIIDNNCKIFGNKHFAAEYVKKLSYFIPIGFFGPKIQLNNNISKNNILFCKGFGSNNENFEKHFSELYKCFKNKNDIIFDKNIKFANQLKVKVADSFNENLFNRLKIIIGRPSFGILTESIVRSIPFFPISDKNDLESIETKKQINKLFGKGKNIETYLENSIKLYKKNFFSFNAEEKILIKIMENI